MANIILKEVSKEEIKDFELGSEFIVEYIDGRYVPATIADEYSHCPEGTLIEYRPGGRNRIITDAVRIYSLPIQGEDPKEGLSLEYITPKEAAKTGKVCYLIQNMGLFPNGEYVTMSGDDIRYYATGLGGEEVDSYAEGEDELDLFVIGGVVKYPDTNISLPLIDLSNTGDIGGRRVMYQLKNGEFGVGTINTIMSLVVISNAVSNAIVELHTIRNVYLLPNNQG